MYGISVSHSHILRIKRYFYSYHTHIFSALILIADHVLAHSFNKIRGVWVIQAFIEREQNVNKQQNQGECMFTSFVIGQKAAHHLRIGLFFSIQRIHLADDTF